MLLLALKTGSSRKLDIELIGNERRSMPHFGNGSLLTSGRGRVSRDIAT
jgi:hypothetical protein